MAVAETVAVTVSVTESVTVAVAVTVTESVSVSVAVTVTGGAVPRNRPSRSDLD